MNTELQNKVWSLLPKEFKEEVKKEWRRAYYNDTKVILEYFFGKHNLTSDAEGEEMLMVERKRVQNLYDSHKLRRHHLAGEALINLFGSKCLPDEAASESASKVANEEPRPAEPKFKVSDTASYVCSPTLKHKCTVTKVMQNEHSGKWEYNVMFEWGKPGMWIPESDLEPYTEPKKEDSQRLHAESVEESRIASEESHLRNLSRGCNKDFDNFIKDGFREHNRLHIAAMVIASIMGNNDWSDYRGGTDEDVWRNMAKASLGVADALLSEAEKGDSQ